MAFFKKLKDRLFKSSSRIDEGLEAIVDDGGVEEQVEPSAVDHDAERIAEEARQAEAARAAEEVRQDDAARAAEEVRLAGDARRAEEASRAEARAAAEAAEEEQKARDAAEAQRAASLAAAARLASEGEAAAARAAAEEQARAAEERARAVTEQAEAARRAEVEAARAAEEERVARESAARRAEAEAKEVERRAAAESLNAPSPEPARKPGLLGRIMGRSEAKTVIRRTLDDDMLEQLEELLIAADMGVDTALRVTANMAEGRMGRKLSVQEIKELMAGEIARIMEPVAKPLPLYPKTPQVVLVVGVNGSGKTTTIGKLASQFRAAGKSVVIAAGDTFRAAAVEQLQVWGERAGVPVLTAPEGSDPASLAFEAMTKAQDSGADLLMIDTAGRLQNRGDLMEELAKIVRVIRKKDPSAPHNTLLVLDATTGQNALNQVKVFQEVSDVSGLVMTKLDGTAKGGVLVALADKFGLPIHAIGVGEQIDDLQPFDPEDFAAALTGLDIA